MMIVVVEVEVPRTPRGQVRVLAAPDINPHFFLSTDSAQLSRGLVD